MPSEIAQHRHCQMCGKAIPLEEIFCSEECKTNYEKLIKKRRKLILVMYVVLLVMFIAFLLIGYL